MLFTTLCFLSTFNFSEVLASEEKEIIEGIYIDSVHIGTMTKEEANDAIVNYIEELKEKTITVEIEDESEQVSLGELGFTNREHDFIEQAINIGETGNLINRYKEIKEVSHNNLMFSLEYIFDENLFNEFAETKLSAYNIPAQNASLKREGGKFVYFEHVVGRSVVVEETIKSIEKAVNENWNKDNFSISAVISFEEPKYKRDMVEKVDSNLGSFTTNYSNSSSSRAANLDNGAKLINNTVLYPGEEFNAYELLAPFSTSNGYSVGGAYSNGMLVDSIGGGACQVTTTIYNAALYAEMDITERAAHSMTVSYVDLSRDAAIAGTYKNLRFINNTEYPVLIQSYTKNRNITFTIWGHETRPANRTVKYETVVLSKKNPPEDKITKDPTKPTSYKQTTQSSYTGYVAELYKIVYEDGKQVSRERVNKSSYMAAPRYVTIGTMEETKPEPTEAPDPTKPAETAASEAETAASEPATPEPAGTEPATPEPVQEVDPAA